MLEIIGAVKDTWPLIILGLVALAYIIRCRKRERAAMELKRRIEREVARTDAAKAIAAIPQMAQQNDKAYAKMFGNTR